MLPIRSKATESLNLYAYMGDVFLRKGHCNLLYAYVNLSDLW